MTALCLLALLAQTDDLHRVCLHLKMKSFCYLLLTLLYGVIVELDDISTIGADEMVMMLSHAKLILFSLCTKRDGAGNPFVLKQGKCSVDRSDTDVDIRMCLFDLHMDLFRREVPFMLIQKCEDELTLLGELQCIVLQERFELLKQYRVGDHRMLLVPTVLYCIRSRGVALTLFSRCVRRQCQRLGIHLYNGSSRFVEDRVEHRVFDILLGILFDKRYIR